MNDYLEQKITDFVKLKGLIAEGDKILVALSGGADSVFLLRHINKLKNRFNCAVAACHVNHNLRGAESDTDETFCRKLCNNLEIEFASDTVDVKNFAKENSLSIEEAARELRYSVLRKYAEKLHCSKIATAHNSDDNAETVLLNLFKGKGISALAGIPVRRGNIVRPLLCVAKKEIVDYLNANKYEFRFDSTNENNIYQRNFIRNNVVPLIKENINPKLEEALFRNSEILHGTTNLLDEIFFRLEEEFTSIDNNEAEINLTLVNEFGTNTLVELVKRIFENKFGKEFHFSDKNLLLKLIGGQVGKKLELSEGIVIFKERNSIHISYGKPDTFFERKIRIGESVQTPMGSLKIETADAPENLKNRKENVEFASADNLAEVFVVRNWRYGDKFYPLGMEKPKKVSDYLTDAKIPSNLRKKQLVLTNNNEIIWLVGQRLDNRFKLNDKTKRVIKLWLN